MKKLLSFFMFICVGFAFGQDYSGLINTYLTSNRAQLGLQAQDLADVKLDRQSNSKSMDLDNVYILQRYQGIEIYNAIASMAIKDGEVVYATNTFENNISQKVNTTSPSINAVTAISKAAQALNLATPANIEVVEEVATNHAIYSNGEISLNNIPVKLVFQKMDDNSLKLAWDLSIYLLDASHYYSVRIDATTGELINTADWVVSCSHEGHTGHSAFVHEENSVLFGKNEAELVAAGGAQYRVFPIPAESPNHGPEALIADPSNADASPFGWHDTDGVDGAEYTITRGNNVWSQDDINGNNGTGTSADGGDELNFDFPYEFDLPPNEWIEAATVNLFYMNNIMHDVFYHYGFDEESGNFQVNNYGNGGNGNDMVLADAQDGSGINNANFATPPDGGNPRMQMFLWDGAVSSGPILTLNNGPLAGDYDGIPAGFGGDIVDLTEDLVLVEDDASGTADTNDACDPITNGADLNGKIAVIRRGECEFGFKGLAAQNEGAVAVIMVNNVPGDPIIMGAGAVGDQVTIPMFMLSDVDGEPIIAELMAASINGTINGVTIGQQIDGDLDNGVIAHEYGHGISNRLTGGPNNTGCLNNAEQMGEGWSDYVGLILTMEPGDGPADRRGIGTFVQGQDTDGNGIRQYPYSRDMTINPLTYADLPATGGQVHAVGTIWATMLWDLTWFLIDEHGWDSDIYNGTGGNNIAAQLVLDGMKLQPCSPGFEDGRDAILAADQAANGGANECIIWGAFARRGLGFSASQGTSGSVADGTPAFDIPPSCDPLGVNDNGLGNSFIIYPNPSNGNINVQSLMNLGEATISIYDINGRKVYNQEVTMQDTVNINAENLTAGMYILQINGADYSHSAKLVIN